MIELRNVSISAGAFVLRDINFKIEAGEYAVLMGRTGCGKTTLLDAICGLRQIADGEILLQGRPMHNCAPAQRGIGYVPQDAALFRSMTVREHLGFAPLIRRWSDADIAARVFELAELLGLTKLLDRRPLGLSGGEGHRVALGRALSFRPAILCMDEPLSALDDETRDEMYRLLQNVRKHTRVTVLHVSHNRTDAEKLADIMLQLKDGQVIRRVMREEKLSPALNVVPAEGIQR
jgi:molybdate/tungstate transport system ATP-binding protein